MPVPCPGCGSLLNVTDTSCNTCLRQRSRQEIFRGARQEKEEADAIRDRPKRIAKNILVVAALAGGAGYAWTHHQARILSLVKLAQERLSPPPAPPAPAPAPAAPAAPAAAPAPYSYTAAPAETAPPAAAPGGPAAPSKAPATAAYDDRWTIKGLAYDLFSLKGVAKAEVTFIDKTTGQRFGVRTDAKGRYEVKLPRLKEGGYDVAVSHKKYRSSYLDEMEPPYLSQSRSRRNDAVELLNVLHVPVLLQGSEDTLDHNLILLPNETEDQ